MLDRIRLGRAVVLGIVASLALGIYVWASTRPHKPAQPPIVSCEPMDSAALWKHHPRKHLVGSDVGGMGMFHYELAWPTAPDGEIRRELFHPNVAIQAFDGWLFGSDRGEFGGELVFRKEPETRLLLRENVENIYKMPFGFVATTGFSHLETHYGNIYVITENPQAKPRAAKLHPLPSWPASSWLLESGDLLVNTREGSVVLRQDGELVRVSCVDGT